MDRSWLSLCQAPTSSNDSDSGSGSRIQAWDHVVLGRSDTSMILQVVPGLCNGKTIQVHSLVYEVLACCPGVQTDEGPFSIDPMSMAAPMLHGWSMIKCNVRELPRGSKIACQVLYMDEGLSIKKVKRLLENRVIRRNAIIVLSELCIVRCVSIDFETTTTTTTTANSDATPIAVRVGTSVCLELLNTNEPISSLDESTVSSAQHDCPGYETLLADLQDLTQPHQPGRPTGILLTGCAGVGKTRLAAALASSRIKVHTISAHDLMVQASWATQEDLLKHIKPPQSNCPLVIIDDLSVMELSSDHDVEWMLVRNTLLIAMDQWIHDGVSILGIAIGTLPPEFTKRLEVHRTMLPPTQAQREVMLESILRHDVGGAKALSGALAGCVAADMQQLSVYETWDELLDASRRCIPSQLAQLDVTKTPTGPFTDYAQNHEWAWKDFGGYHEIKKRIFRTVVMPWRRFLDHQADGAFSISPPRGVLFHGVPGVGKTFAAGCLAASIGLHVVRVRASDVLDKWLGGSEAAIRSLFARARGAAPCILFFDEIDAIASNRENDNENDVSSRILTTFLNEMDGVSSDGSSGVLVVACTNRLQDLDAALLRPGRLEEHVPLARPSHDDALHILQLALAKVPKANDMILGDIAELFVELKATGADIDGVCRDACSIAIQTATDLNDVRLTKAQVDIAMKKWKGDTQTI
jgi:SpoVK/Ycf46/Vps4 family AAA+-type ATPase